ncbi:MAG: YraN family protein [Pseudomonadota bacterium]
MANRARQRAERRGRWAELYAAAWLQAKGYAVLARRVKQPLGEIDLIARRSGVLAFIEVKQRPTLDLAQDAVPTESWLRISRVAANWAGRQPQLQNLDWRYDLVAITPWALPTHFRDYWRP